MNIKMRILPILALVAHALVHWGWIVDDAVSWTYAAMLHEHPRFRSDYLPIVSYEDPYAARTWGVSVPSEHFVRWDLVAGPDAARKRYQAPGDRR